MRLPFDRPRKSVPAPGDEGGTVNLLRLKRNLVIAKHYSGGWGHPRSRARRELKRVEDEQGFVMVMALLVIVCVSLAAGAAWMLAVGSQNTSTNEQDRVEAAYMSEAVSGAEAWSVLNAGASLVRNQWYMSGRDNASRFKVLSEADPLTVTVIAQSTRGKVCRESRQQYVLAAGPSDPGASRVQGSYSESGCREP